MTRFSPARAALVATALAVAPLATLPSGVQAQIVLQSFAPLVEAAKPAVVTVTTSAAPRAAMRAPGNDQMDEFMERFFDRAPPPGPRGQRPARGIGSGFVIDASGIIVTNNHVIDNAEQIRVILDDGTELDAELIGRDTRVDIAVLRVDAGRDLPTVAWGDSDALRVGDWAVAIGNPLGLNGTVTAGIVSARGRDINSGPYDDYIQVDAAINRGNSGGPLFNLEGDVVGVNTAIISPSGGNVGLGFAIPAAQAQDIVAQLIEDGQVDRGWIGVAIQPVTRDIAKSIGLEDSRGALVAEVTPDSPAQASGLRAGDVILSFAGTVIEDLRDLTTSVAKAGIGAQAQMTVWRNDAELTLDIRPALLETAALQIPALPDGQVLIPELGLALAETPQGDGAIVRDVRAGPASDGGLRAGDVIVSINQRPVDAPDTAQTAVSEAVQDDRPTLLILVDRDGARRFLTIDMTQT